MLIRVRNNFVQCFDHLITKFLLESVAFGVHILWMIQKPGKAQESLHNIAHCLYISDASTDQSLALPNSLQHVCICLVHRIEVGLPRIVICTMVAAYISMCLHSSIFSSQMSIPAGDPGAQLQRQARRCHRYPHHKVVYGKVKAGPVVGTAAGEVLQTYVPGAEQLRVHSAPNMQRDNDPVREVRGRVQYGIWVPRNRTGVLESDFVRARSRRSNKAGAGLRATPEAVMIVR